MQLWSVFIRPCEDKNSHFGTMYTAAKKKYIYKKKVEYRSKTKATKISNYRDRFGSCTWRMERIEFEVEKIEIHAMVDRVS